MTSRNNKHTRAQTPSILAALLAATLVGCSGSGDSEDTVAVNGDVAIAYAKRVNTLGMNPTDGAPFAAGGDLIIREKSSPAAPSTTSPPPIRAASATCRTPRCLTTARRSCSR